MHGTEHWNNFCPNKDKANIKIKVTGEQYRCSVLHSFETSHWQYRYQYRHFFQVNNQTNCSQKIYRYLSRGLCGSSSRRRLLGHLQTGTFTRQDGGKNTLRVVFANIQLSVATASWPELRRRTVRLVGGSSRRSQLSDNGRQCSLWFEAAEQRARTARTRGRWCFDLFRNVLLKMKIK